METIIFVLIFSCIVFCVLWLIACKESRCWERELFDEVEIYNKWKKDRNKEIELLKLYDKELAEEFIDTYGVSQKCKKAIKDRCMKRAKAKLNKESK